MVKWMFFFMLLLFIFTELFLAFKTMAIDINTEADVIATMKSLFGAISVVSLAIIYYIRLRYASHDRILTRIKEKSLKINPKLVELFMKRVDDTEIKKAGGVILFTNTIDMICWGLSGTLVNYGFMLTFMSKNIMDFYMFAGISLLALIMQAPSFSRFSELVQKVIDVESESLEP